LVSVITSLKSYLKRSFTLQCFVLIFRNLYNNIRQFFGIITTDSGTTHAQLLLSDSLAYINNVFEDYKKYANISHFHGHVCELGPGDNVSVALRILADGAQNVDLADRFYSHRNFSDQAKIYEALIRQNPKIAQHLKTAYLKDETTFPGIARYYGPQAAGETFFKKRPMTYDFIVSRSVLEHTIDPLQTLRDMYQALKPGGMLIHKIDLRDHKLFTPFHHDLKFLEIPQAIYWAMTRHSGLPNRILIDQYRTSVSNLPGTYQFLITHLAYEGPVEPHVLLDQIPKKQFQDAIIRLAQHKQCLASSFQTLKDDDLIVSGFFLIVKKPY